MSIGRERDAILREKIQNILGNDLYLPLIKGLGYISTFLTIFAIYFWPIISALSLAGFSLFAWHTYFKFKKALGV